VGCSTSRGGGLRELLAATDDIAVVGESGLAEEVVRRIPALRPDVAIFTPGLPTGPEPMRAGGSLGRPDNPRGGPHLVRRRGPVAAAVLAGASGYLLKDIRGNRIVEAIRRVAEGLHQPADRRGDVTAEKAVKNYITSVLAKMGLERRTQAAVYAVQHPSTPSRRAR
jgi:two-component system, NarL family, response regulator DevR